jgi:hypothetical protein
MPRPGGLWAPESDPHIPFGRADPWRNGLGAAESGLLGCAVRGTAGKFGNLRHEALVFVAPVCPFGFAIMRIVSQNTVRADRGQEIGACHGSAVIVRRWLRVFPETTRPRQTQAPVVLPAALVCGARSR